MSGSNGSSNGHRRVAVTGLGAVSPVGIGVDAFWEALLAGRSGIAEIEGFDTEAQRVRIAGEVRDFDPSDWLPAKDVKRNDPLSHLALAAAQLAVDDAAFEAQDPERVATVFGTAAGGFRTMVDQTMQLHERGPRMVSPFTIPAMLPNMAAGAISIRFGFGGPSMCPVSACASSADAVGWGFRMVRDGYADACLTGGAEALTNALSLAAFANLRALSTKNDAPQGASRPFDLDRDGFVLAEGAAALMLEPLDRAIARGAPVYGEVCGYGQASDAHHATAPDPSGKGAVRAIRAALAEAGEQPERIGYVNAHGTSTPLSDAVETKALKQVFGGDDGGPVPVPVSSTKSMTGHLLGAAGALESAACLLAMRDGWLPPTINYTTPDPDCDIDCVPNEARRSDVDVALCNAMGFGGHNVALVFRRPE
jgi:3-oxoacyl-[acyl-carrier-protein] synthase II